MNKAIKKISLLPCRLCGKIPNVAYEDYGDLNNLLGGGDYNITCSTSGCLMHEVIPFTDYGDMIDSMNEWNYFQEMSEEDFNDYNNEEDE